MKALHRYATSPSDNNESEQPTLVLRLRSLSLKVPLIQLRSKWLRSTCSLPQSHPPWKVPINSQREASISWSG